jgi:hypothetical protein
MAHLPEPVPSPGMVVLLVLHTTLMEHQLQMPLCVFVYKTILLRKRFRKVSLHGVICALMHLADLQLIHLTLENILLK